MNSIFYDTIPSFQEGREYDPDSSPMAWKHYRTVYDPEDWNEYDLKNVHYFKFLEKKDKTYANCFYIDEPHNVDAYSRLYALKNGYVSRIENNKTYFQATLRLSGETDFDFKEDNNSNNKNKYAKFRCILNKDLKGEKLENALFELNNCKGKHHSLVNFSLMQTVGNMQGVKSKGIGDYLDRLDSFIFLLNDYYSEGKNEQVLSESRYNKALLEEFLSIFTDIYDYCRKVYFLKNKDFVDRIISEGGKQIKTAEDVIRYMKLANDFWMEKLKSWACLLD